MATAFLEPPIDNNIGLFLGDDMIMYIALSMLILIAMILAAKNIKHIWKPLSYNAKIIITSVTFILISTIVLWCSYDQSNKILSWFLSTLSAIMISGVALSMLSELFFKENLLKEINSSISDNFLINKSISEYHLKRIEQKWSLNSTIERICTSKKCIIFGIFNSQILKNCQTEIIDHINNGNELTLVVLDKNKKESVEYLKSKFLRIDSVDHELEIVSQLFNDLSCAVNCTDKFNLKTYDYVLTYSAYVFDDEEIWLIFNSSQSKPNFLPVLIFQGEKHQIQNSPFYKELFAVLDKSHLYAQVKS